MTSSMKGGLYWRRTGDVLEFSDRLGWLCESPSVSDVDLPVLVAMALGVECMPDRTHLRLIGRVPAGATARFSLHGVVLSSDYAFTSAMVEQPGRPAMSADRLAKAIRELTVWGSRGPIVIADGGGAGSRLLARHRPPVDPAEPGTVTAGRADGPADGESDDAWPGAWPVLWSRHVPAACAAIAAAEAEATTVVTGHGLRALLTASAAELAKAAPGRWMGEPSGAGRIAGHESETQEARSAEGETAAGPSAWLTPDGAWQVGAVASASHQTWETWSGFPDARMRELLRAWADPGLAWLRETADLHGVELFVAAWSPLLLSALIQVPPHERVAVRDGLIVNGPLLGDGRSSPGAGGDHRCRKAAAQWAASPAGAAALDQLAKGFLMDSGLLDGGRIRESAADPFTRTRYALSLRRLYEADAWLARL